MAKLSIGVIVSLSAEGIEKTAALGLRSCQVSSWDPDAWTDEAGENLVATAQKHGVKISTFWSGYSGPAKWNFTEGPSTIGLVPAQYRQQRTRELIRAAQFAAKFHLPQIATHVGFLPEDPKDAPTGSSSRRG